MKIHRLVSIVGNNSKTAKHCAITRVGVYAEFAIFVERNALPVQLCISTVDKLITYQHKDLLLGLNSGINILERRPRKESKAVGLFREVSTKSECPNANVAYFFSNLFLLQVRLTYKPGLETKKGTRKTVPSSLGTLSHPVVVIVRAWVLVGRDADAPSSLRRVEEQGE